MFERLRNGLTKLVDKVATTELKAETLHPILEDFKLDLIKNDVAISVADHLSEQLETQLDGVEVKRLQNKRETVRKHLRHVLLDILTVNESIQLVDVVEKKKQLNEPCVVLFVGINGTGKTTTIAKVAKHLINQGYSVVLACSDTYRAGSIEQLQEHANNLDVRMIKHQYGSDAAAVAYDAVSHAEARGLDAVLIDTAGRLQTDRNLMNELQKIKRVINPDLTILTVDALTGNDAATQAEEFHRKIGINGTILTKVDADVKGGSALSVTYLTSKPILFIGTGQEYGDLQMFNPEKFTNMILK